MSKAEQAVDRLSGLQDENARLRAENARLAGLAAGNGNGVGPVFANLNEAQRKRVLQKRAEMARAGIGGLDLEALAQVELDQVAQDTRSTKK